MYNKVTMNVRRHIDKVRNINEAAKIVAVTKYTNVDFVNIAIKAGIDTLGENRVQEFLDKFEHYDSKNIHFIGHLQTNKVKYIIDKVNLIQSVDSIKLAKVIDEQAFKHNNIMDILVQINVSNEDSKNGIDICDTKYIIDELSALKNINIRGFMTIPMKKQGIELERDFDKMHEVFSRYDKYDILSMGMSSDFELALKHGSTMVRIGTGLFT